MYDEFYVHCSLHNALVRLMDDQRNASTNKGEPEQDPFILSTRSHWSACLFA